MGKKEIEYRQNLFELEKLVKLGGIISRRKRKSFLRFLHHPDPRIRKYAAELDSEDERMRALPLNEEHAYPFDGPDAEDDIPFPEDDIDNASRMDAGALLEDDADIPF